eukprot:CAMPEP_0202868662 /NCGR_PEP_ID=MMETSP1391-20130828/10999_1 /ASSEMBLY_ACC=CAM_ASM_000867 /TAXON_ID=1034604 /ORGANISM="Chlamydomonas leiostraca, Strain SAG 11-49" /LENGTH=479 /DNA_ID=CAMNT_0049548857 /DNA_START=229 /DNA_END=1668 /DNA_ORIENTATION=-
MAGQEELFELEDEGQEQGRQVDNRPQSESGTSSWGSDVSYHDCVTRAEDCHLSWAIGDLENAAAMAWRTLQRRGCATLQHLAHLMANTIGRAVVRTGLGAGSAVESMSQLRHSFLICRHPQAPGVDLYVDPLFRDQFVLSRTDDEYESFLGTVPQLFVGSLSMLRASVRVCGDLMGEAMERAGMSRPPWRESAALLSKWSPLHWRDELYMGMASSPDHAGGAVPGPALAQAIVASMRPGAAPVPARVTVHSFKHGSKVVEVTSVAGQAQGRPGQAGAAAPAMAGVPTTLAGLSAATKVPRVPVVRVADAPPRTQVVGFRAQGSAPASSHAAAAGCSNAAAAAARAGLSPCSSAVGSLAVSSLSDEFVAVQWAERKGQKRATGSSRSSKAPSAGKPDQEASSSSAAAAAPANAGAAAAANAAAVGIAKALAGAVAEASSSNALPAGAKPQQQQQPVQQWMQFKPLDQLLPQIRTVKLGGV